jgi:uncharacterized protein involved in exopolysaccharide biosynthesis
LTNQELVRKILLRLGKLKWLILLGGILFGALLFMFARSKPTIYSARSTLFPLTSGPDQNSASAKLSELIGASGGNSKSLTEDANVNIEEVAKSKKTREAVAAARIPSYGNKTVALILIEEYNKYRTFLEQEAIVPKVDTVLYAIGADFLKEAYTVKFNKNSLLEVNFKSKDEKLLEPITTILTDKITEFYKELKIKKAKFDYNFLEAKVDSFNRLLAHYDRQIISLDNTTLFVQPTKLQYILPKEKLESEKILVTAQRNSAVYNREEALLRLEKVTPIIETLDKPTPPYDFKKPSKLLYVGLGFVFGILLFSFLCIVNLLFKFSSTMVQTTISEKMANPQN